MNLYVTMQLEWHLSFSQQKKKEWHLSQNYIEIGILFVYYIIEWASTLIYRYSIPFDRF